MLLCPDCHQENPEQFLLCGYCGAELIKLGAAAEQRKTVTIIFCDLKGSTSLGERLDSEALREVLGVYFSAMKQVIERNGGLVEKYIGDAIMAVFGLPTLHEDDALRAALVLTDKFVTGRAQPDKAIDVLDEACAHAQATASLPAELEKIVNERRRVDAAVRRRLARGERLEDGAASGGPAPQASGTDPEESDPLEAFAREVGPALERLGAEIEKLFGGGSSPEAAAEGEPRAERGPGTAAPSRREGLIARRDRLDNELRRGLESLGIVVRGQDVARAVGVAVGKRIEWTS